MSETLYLSKKNTGLWSIYRKKCFDKNNKHITNDTFCTKMFELLFKDQSKH